jgi:hypothetical protein
LSCDRANGRYAHPQKWETYIRLRRTDTRECASYAPNSYLSRKPNFAGIDVRVFRTPSNLTWDFIKRQVTLFDENRPHILVSEDAKRLSTSVSTRSSYPTTAAGPRTAALQPSRRFQKS